MNAAPPVQGPEADSRTPEAPHAVERRGISIRERLFSGLPAVGGQAGPHRASCEALHAVTGCTSLSTPSTPVASEAFPPRETPSPSGFLRSIRAALVGTDQDFTEGNLTRAILLLAIPMVLEMAMESLFALVNTLWVSRLGAAATASVGLTESMMAIVYTVAMGFAMAGTAMVARRIGEKDARAASVAAAQVLWLGLLAGAVMGLGGGLFAPQLLRLMGAAEQVV